MQLDPETISSIEAGVEPTDGAAASAALPEVGDDPFIGAEEIAIPTA